MEKHYRSYLAEMIGTFTLVFVGGAAVCLNGVAAVAWQPQPNLDIPVIVQPQPGLVGIALAQGFILAAALAAVLPYSDGYLNPALTLIFWVFKKFDFLRMCALIASQMIGAAMAGGLLRVLFFFREDVLIGVRLGTPHLNLRLWRLEDLSFTTICVGIGLEMIFSFILTIVVLSTLSDPKFPGLKSGTGRWLAPLWTGLTLSALILCGFTLTGTATNPARFFGTALWELTIPTLKSQNPLGDHMVYWMGPVLGALLAGGVYFPLIQPSEKHEEASHHGARHAHDSKAESTRFKK